jgi:hypothetical protein
VAGRVSRRDSAPVPHNSTADVASARGGQRLLKAALLVLAVWSVGALGLYDAGELIHALLLVGLMLLMLGALKVREAAKGQGTDSSSDAR